MITIPEEAKSLFQQNYRQLIKIEFPNNGKTIRLTESDIVTNSFKWDRYCATGNMLEIGTATAAEIEFSLRNTGKFLTVSGEEIPVDEILFEGKELTVDIGVYKWGARRWEDAQVYWMPIGKFTIMSKPHKFSVINISALDRMTWFDMYVPVEGTPFSNTETLQSIVHKMCNAIGISYSLPSYLPNLDLAVDIPTLYEDEPEATYRTLVQWVAALTGTCAYIDPSGRLCFKWLDRAQNVLITPSKRYSSVVYDPVGFSGLIVEKGDSSMELGSNSYYRYAVLDNSLIQGDKWINSAKYIAAVNNLWEMLDVSSVAYRPYDASILPAPYLEPLDIISYQDNNGEVFDTIITHITFSLNGATNISAVGISDTEAQCVTPSGRTPRESADIKALRNMVSTLENATVAARERLTDIVRMALGLHLITVTDDNGGKVYYMTTANISNATPDYAPTLDDLRENLVDNDVIYFVSGAGIAWCTGADWDFDTNAPKVEIGWRYGISKDGNAVLGQVNTTGIQVSKDDTTYRTEITPEGFSVYNGQSFVFGFNGQLESQINRLLVKANIKDPTMENNAYIRLGSAMLVPADGGLDIVYVEDI